MPMTHPIYNLKLSSSLISKVQIMSQFQETALKNLKTIIIGSTNVGKSTLLLRYVKGDFNPQQPTIGVDYIFKRVEYEGNQFNLQLWDSAGQERYRTIIYNYFTLSKAAIVVFDLTNESSLADAKTWLQQLVLHCGNDIPILLLGNKSDLIPQTQLMDHLSSLQTRIDQLKNEYKCHFFAVSALTGDNINEAFAYLIKQIYTHTKMRSSVGEYHKLKLSKMKLEQSIVQKHQQKKCC